MGNTVKIPTDVKPLAFSLEKAVLIGSQPL
jgi:hypothetical protein